MTKELHEAVAMSIFTESGWWGNSIHPYFLGSKINDLKRETQSKKALQDSKSHVEKALKWLVDDGVCESFSVSSFFENNDLNISVNIKTKDGSKEMIFKKGKYDSFN